MADKAASLVWIDANGRTRQTIIKTLTGVGSGISTSLAAASTGAIQSAWEGTFTVTGAVPAGGLYQAMADAASLQFQTAAGNILRVTLPAPLLGIFKPDKVTVDPTNALVLSIIGACVGDLSDGAGHAAVSYLGGVYLRGSRTDLDTP